MTDRQRNDLVEVISRYDNGQPAFEVYVAWWPHLDRPGAVMWLAGDRYSYLSAAAARRFAAALIQAAAKIEQTDPQEGP